MAGNKLEQHVKILRWAAQDVIALFTKIRRIEFSDGTIWTSCQEGDTPRAFGRTRRALHRTVSTETHTPISRSLDRQRGRSHS